MAEMAPKRRRIEVPASHLPDLPSPTIFEDGDDGVRMRLTVHYNFVAVVMNGSIKILVCEMCLACPGAWKTWDVEVKDAPAFVTKEQASSHLLPLAPFPGFRFYSWDEVDHFVAKKTLLNMTFFEAMKFIWE